MADSVDRVFGHALNTVNKIRPGSQKPPATDRLKLYGLYKQSMEGDVSHIASRPPSTADDNGSAEHNRKEQEKWDAWRANDGLSRTEAKRRYIETLIETMRVYASTTDEARELVGELEFVWDQVRGNSVQGSSERSSPLRGEGYLRGGGSEGAAMGGEGLRVLSPMSQSEEEALGEEEGEEFVDARVSQVGAGEVLRGGVEEVRQTGDEKLTRRVAKEAGQGERKWRRSIEASLIKLTTEVAAVREQLESRSYSKQLKRRSWFGWVLRLGWWAVQLVVADAFLLWLVILYLRRKQDRRLEGAVRVLLGDAVAQVQKVTGREVRMPARIAQIASRKGV